MTTTTPAKHPAKYSDSILPVLARFLPDTPTFILDPFAGTGKGVDYLRSIGHHAYGIELEPEWAAQSPYVIVGNALYLPFPDGVIGAICTSPVYGNRVSDHHDAKDSSRRITYRHKLGRALHPANAGQLQFGTKYREFHIAVWRECLRVMAPNALFVLNISDHVRRHKIVPVTSWHKGTLMALGLEMLAEAKVDTPRMRQGENHEARVEYESVILFRKPAQSLTPEHLHPTTRHAHHPQHHHPPHTPA